MTVLLIDNYDSFTYNLAQQLTVCGAHVRTVRNDEITLAEIAHMRPEAIVLSPGPGNPGRDEACLGVGAACLRELSETIPTLGVCLGHQGIGVTFGARVIQARSLMHGKTSSITHDGQGVFAGVPAPLVVGRYHSLALDLESIPDVLEVSALSADGVVMGLRHRTRPLHGIQFHPESVLTPEGDRLITNFLSLARVGAASCP